MVKDIRAELMSGALMLTGGRDVNAAAIIVYDASKHDPAVFEPLHLLKLALYLVHHALQDPLTLKNGFTIVLSNLTGAPHEKDFRNVLLTTMQDRYPARINKVLLTGGNAMTQLLLRFSTPFMKRKLKKKVGSAARCPCAGDRSSVQAVTLAVRGCASKASPGFP